MVEEGAPRAKSTGAWLKRALVLTALAVLVGGLWFGRWVALRLSVRSTVQVVRDIADALPESSGEKRSAREDLLFPLWPFDSLPERQTLPGGDEVPSAPEASSPRNAPRKLPMLPPVGPLPIDSRASVDHVLKWADQELVPRGMSRPAADGFPAGIELYGVAPLGIGLIDGDRLVTVDGVSVVEREQVVGAVLGARARRAEAMNAGLVRRTKDGPAHFTVVVEQPYPEHISGPPAGHPDESGGEPEENDADENQPTERPPAR